MSAATVTYRQTIARRLVLELTGRGVDTNWLARETGIDRDLIEAALNGEHPFTVDELHRIVTVLDLHPSDLLDGR